jgi:hypothetical protein
LACTCDRFPVALRLQPVTARHGAPAHGLPTLGRRVVVELRFSQCVPCSVEAFTGFGVYVRPFPGRSPTSTCHGTSRRTGARSPHTQATRGCGAAIFPMRSLQCGGVYRLWRVRATVSRSLSDFNLSRHVTAHRRTVCPHSGDAWLWSCDFPAWCKGLQKFQDTQDTRSHTMQPRQKCACSVRIQRALDGHDLTLGRPRNCVPRVPQGCRQVYDMCRHVRAWFSGEIFVNFCRRATIVGCFRRHFSWRIQ